MKITALVEDTSLQGLPAEHGLSLWIEACGRKFLFDLGQGDLFARNAASLGIDLREAEFAVISHGHYDHGGGIPHFLEINGKAPVYAHRDAFSGIYGLYNDECAFIGLSQELKDDGRIIKTDGTVEISEGIILFSGGSGREFFPPDNARMFKEADGRMLSDDFSHEQSLIIRERGNNVLIAGCSHSGILNIAARAEEITGEPLSHIIAGMHLMGAVEDSFIEGLAQGLLHRGCRCYTCHCTGRGPYERLRSVMGEQVSFLSTGDVIEL